MRAFALTVAIALAAGPAVAQQKQSKAPAKGKTCKCAVLSSAIMRALFVVILLFPTFAFAQSKAPDTCYAAFPGAKGKRCCDKSYARRAQGSMSNDERMSELSACTGRK
ncbi:hypothetical protein [Bradyrhizobium sp. Bra78]|uniref:hypothetical protein n=1 Tax=Bradyrhizobium sp. Bra78 TaxID=2926010 RepID=UPI0021C8AFA7|nr:hypothetical protein [Bradyrhizobium sp. Bra78]